MSLFFAAVVVGSTCLQVEPARVTVEGILHRETFAGRPNYESTAEGDEPETYFLLKLPTPKCLEGTQVKAEDLQLVFMGKANQQYKKLAPAVGKNVSCSGSLFEAISGHHHTPVLLQVSKCSLITTRPSRTASPCGLGFPRSLRSLGAAGRGRWVS